MSANRTRDNIFAWQDDVDATLAEILRKLRQPGFVNEERLADSSVTEEKLADESITAAKIQTGAVTSDAIAEQSITAEQIQFKSLSGDHIKANSITAEEIAAGTITADEIAARSITADKIVVGTLTSTEIAARAITADRISAGTLTAFEIQAGSITGDRLVANTITAGQIAAATITSTQIAASTITASNIAAATITAAQIAAATITGDRIVGRTITAGLVATGTLTANEIATGTITATQIQTGTLTATQIAAGSITGDRLTAGTITATQIAAATITAGKLVAHTLTANEIAAGTITATEIAAATITATQIATGTITATQVAAGSITGDRLVAGTITSTQIAASAITATQLATGSVTSTKISVSDLTAISANMGTLTSGRIRIGTAGGSRIEVGQSIVTSAGTFDGIVGADSSNAVTFLINAATGAAQFKGAIQSGSSGLGNISGQIDGNANVLDNTITGAKLIVDAITAREIATDAVTTQKILARTILAGDIATGTLTANEIAAATITGDRLVAGTVTATQIAAATITGDRLVAGTITATQIAANTITAAKIAASTITTTEIAANTITAADIAAGTITATEIAAATITGAKIAATTITGDRLVAGTITATQIAAATITGDRLVAGTITATQIATGTITATQIASATITSTQIAANTIVAGNIAAGTITATELAAGSITASKLSVTLGGPNLVSNSSFENPSLPGVGYFNASGASSTLKFKHGSRSLLVTSSAAGNIQAIEESATTRFPVVPGELYTFSIYVWPLDQVRQCSVGARFRDAGGTFISQPGSAIVNPPVGQWTRLSGTVTAPAGAASSGWQLTINSTAAAGERWHLDGIQAERGDVMTAYGPRPDEVLPGTITATEISVATLAAISVDAGTITSGIFRGPIHETAAADPKVRFDSTGIFATDSTGGLTFFLPSDPNIDALFGGEVDATAGVRLTAPTASPAPADNKVRWLDVNSAELGSLYAVPSGYGGRSSAASLIGSVITPLSYYQLVQAHANIQHYYRLSSSGANNQTDRKGTLHLVPAASTGSSNITGLIAGSDKALRIASFPSPTTTQWSGTPGSAENVTNALSVETWFRYSGNTGVDFPIIRRGTSTTFWQMIFRSDSKVDFKIRSGGVDRTVTTAAALTANAKNHLVGTFDGTNLRIYVNGVLSATTAFTGSVDAQGTAPLVLGQQFMAGGAVNTYDADELAVYNGVLSGAVITDHYNTGVTGSSAASSAGTEMTLIDTDGKSSWPKVGNFNASSALAALRIDAGTVTVTWPGGSPVSGGGSISFATAFTGTPVVTCTTHSPAGTVDFVSFTGAPTSTGAGIRVRKGDGTSPAAGVSTTVQWMAIGPG